MENLSENKMGFMPVGKLLVSMSVPIMISMIVQALYNVVDSIFVARISENALTAVSLAFPVQNLMMSIGVGTGVGINAVLSKSLGEKKYNEADKIAVNGIFLAFLSYLVFLVFGMSLVKAYFEAQTDNQEIIRYGISYLTTCCVASIGIFGQITFERLLQSTGKTFYTMLTQGTGAIINIILDPILIFGMFGAPRMGIQGAAVATVIGQIVAFLLAVSFNVRVNREISINMKGFKPDLNTVRKIYSVGIPSIIMLSITSVTTYCINSILMKFSSTATAVFGVYFKLQSFAFMPVFGLNNGMVPIISYNYGARNKERIIRTIRLSIQIAVSIMLLALVMIQVYPVLLLHMFNASEDMLVIGIPALRIISLSYVFAGFSVVAGSVFQAFGNGIMSMLVSVGRQLIVLVPAAYLLSLTGKVNMVWWAYPIAEVASLVISAAFLKVIYDTKIRTMEDNIDDEDFPGNAFQAAE
ncbi:MAG: MATE family efflux transporter [Sedimentibacter sp.]|uniref:MATE family efflux transporter n=1 Tax=Sedimentibacter sp. TaxID=1960295 RepID=UPI0031592753